MDLRGQLHALLRSDSNPWKQDPVPFKVGGGLAGNLGTCRCFVEAKNPLTLSGIISRTAHPVAQSLYEGCPQRSKILSCLYKIIFT